MSTLSPSPYPITRKSFHHKAATLSLACILLTFVAVIAGPFIVQYRGLETKEASVNTVLILALFLIVVSTISGVVALCGLSRHGSKGIIPHSLFGIFLLVYIMGMSVFSMITRKSNKASTERVRIEQTEKYLHALVDQANRQGRVMVETGVYFEKAELLPGLIIVSTYSTPSMARTDFPPDVMDKMVRPDLLKFYKNQPEMDLLRENGVVLIRKYLDKTGELIGEASVGPKDLSHEDDAISASRPHD